jgi:alginate O-acetyltransferase complex protein AlgI
MDLNSPIFLFLFLPLFILFYSLSGKRLKLLFGIFGSLLFYSWGNSRYLLLMIGLTLFAYITARGIDHWRGRRVSQLILWVATSLVVALLVVFKMRTGLAYPLGLSYICFQIIIYFVESYKQQDDCERDMLEFSFYLLLFPKIPVGPIVRYSQVRQQISNLRQDPQQMAEGLRRFLIGFVKKALIADTLATIVTPVFNLQSPVISPGLAWLVIISYSLQLYFDFSGQIDMALGVARMMGITYMENFNFPYISRSISDFWRRWHISLSNWFRDMVFYPLERRRLRWFGQQINILIVFILTGLWHGLTHNFLIWGLIHGMALVFESTSAGRKLRTLWLPIQHLYALSVILIGWVFFRSPSPDFALDFLRRLMGDTRGTQILPFRQTSPLPLIEPSVLLALSLGLVLCIPWKTLLEKKFPKLHEIRGLTQLPMQLAYDAALLLVFLAALAATASAAYYPGIYGTF